MLLRDFKEVKMIVKTYDVKGELYATYTGVVAILKDCKEMRYTLGFNDGKTTRLSVQEVKMEVE